MPYEVVSVPGLLIHGRYRPARESDRVGGDWYEALPTPDGRVLIVVGDVSGHGITALIEMTLLRGKIMAASLHGTDPGVILTETNRQLIRATEKAPVLGTALCAFIDPENGEIAYASAGHPPPVLVQREIGAAFLASEGLMLGLQPRVYETRVAYAGEGSLLVLYTDGLIEFTRDIIAGEKNLLRVASEVAASSADNPALAIKERVLGGASPEDDIAILTVKFGAPCTIVPHPGVAATISTR